MITQSQIDDLMDLVGTAAAVTMVRANQEVPVQARPCCAYQIITDRVESLHQEIQSRAVNVGDATKVDVTRYEKSRATVSLTFIGGTVKGGTGGRDDLELMRTAAGKTLDYFRTHTFADYRVLVLSPTLQDRTVRIEPDYCYQLGFDIRVDQSQAKVQTIERMKKITLKPTRDGVAQADIVVIP